jgi:ATP-dependent helicase HrpB
VEVDRDASNVRQEARACGVRSARARTMRTRSGAAGALVALAYPDRIAMRRGESPAERAAGAGTFMAVADLDGDPAESRICSRRRSTKRGRAALGDAVTVEREVAWDARTEAVRAVERERAGAIVLRERVPRDVDQGEITDALLGAVRAAGVAQLPWSTGAAALRARLAFAHTIAPTSIRT